MKNILDFDIDNLRVMISASGEKSFRADQVFGWLSKGVNGFDEMKNIPKSLREKLAENFFIGLPEAVRIQESAYDETRKILFELPSNDKASSRVESVFMRYKYGDSACISSQIGCNMGCKFCASTVKGLERSLSAGEMYAQVLAMKNLSGRRIDRVVVMGIGEPFNNYESLSGFINIIHSDKGYGLSMRNITVSTCGIIPMIDKFSEDFSQVNLAISLHAPNNEIRKKIMPVAYRYGYDDLLAACRRYTEKTHRRITFEYAMIEGLNSDSKDAEELAKKLNGQLCHVNLIPLNKVDGSTFRPASAKHVKFFEEILEKNGITTTVRRRLGADIDAACGQLRLRD